MKNYLAEATKLPEIVSHIYWIMFKCKYENVRFNACTRQLVVLPQVCYRKFRTNKKHCQKYSDKSLFIEAILFQFIFLSTYLPSSLPFFKNTRRRSICGRQN